MTKDRVSPTQEEKPMREETGANAEDRQWLSLSSNDRRIFVEALINPQPVNDRLRDTVRRHRQATGT
ncbi:hypothetical protein X740_29665 [Mesorhizobium sp. LNHC221B00]|uniref:type II toxin -antitoxin system TacA 1-like antitoxin n=1 Tax=Mesorhizobium sp. LNHC221B00 TaxID=1287233 RepID=UPI0003CDEF59|nr:DUF1778 domain-containing protein [Mesorhizobium sp. LNHC221B00]ESY76302.1 hypothetical protein X740_29665 [Mesorhizobium sp. LNHC221B00]